VPMAPWDRVDGEEAIKIDVPIANVPLLDSRTSFPFL
jgi:hypothetical protein